MSSYHRFRRPCVLNLIEWDRYDYAIDKRYGFVVRAFPFPFPTEGGFAMEQPVADFGPFRSLCRVKARRGILGAELHKVERGASRPLMRPDACFARRRVVIQSIADDLRVPILRRHDNAIRRPPAP